MGQLLSERQGWAKAVELLPQEQGREGWEGAILPGLAASQGITAGSLAMELVRGVGRKGVAAVPWGGLVCGEQVERPGLGKMKASAGCGKRQLLTPFFPPLLKCVYP